MREIKFRAWNKENEKMIYSNETYPSNKIKPIKILKHK